jgi:hypothetical protein
MAWSVQRRGEGDHSTTGVSTAASGDDSNDARAQSLQFLIVRRRLEVDQFEDEGAMSSLEAGLH